MNKTGHRIYIFSLAFITGVVFVLLLFYGVDFYATDVEERFFHTKNQLLKPSGLIGHGLGVLGSAFMVIGVFGYMARKRIRKLSRLGFLRHWLEFHIFLCTLGPILVLYHTSFKFGGLVAVSFWSMVAVVASGIIGRFIYLQIPRTIEGREMSLNELNRKKTEFYAELESSFGLDNEVLSLITVALNDRSWEVENTGFIRGYFRRISYERNLHNNIRNKLNERNFPRKEMKSVLQIVKSEIVLNRRIDWLSTMQNLLRYWHVAHLPFALIMLVIMIIHIVVAILFGYHWIF